ncbi:hypothetical protein DAETH_48870 (plasmid) [Deinococcus aetherius]|uniref:Uncharacterized protein n=1 Tax=Deinococcus aetherius TaxID=200252 RepID=A0ABM8AM49_9DEIO|nr:hypothetical protein [Deinococcus aetherius]BDP44918.1 hypothetical protein DAETH_48870 [Deinococcus aetherius]
MPTPWLISDVFTRAWTLADDLNDTEAQDCLAELRRQTFALPLNRQAHVLDLVIALTEQLQRRQDQGAGSVADESDQSGHDGLNPSGSDLARLHQEAQDLLVLLSRGWTVGPMSSLSLRRTWQSLRGRGLGHRLSAYAITPEGRTVYLVGPHDGEGPRGLYLEGNRAALCGVDEAGQPVSLQGRALARADCYVFVEGDRTG